MHDTHFTDDRVPVQRDAWRPKGAQLDDTAAEPTTFDAAAAGRAEVLGAAGMLQLQRSAGNAAVQRVAGGEPSPVLDVVNSGAGRPLDAPLRAEMEHRLDADFSDVRVHTGDTADLSARSVGANAYTVGSNVVFQRDAYDPSSSDGKTTLAHELTHVMQQRNGAVEGSPAEGGINVSHPNDRFEREASANAERAMRLPAGPAAVQRDAEEPEDSPG